MRTLQEQLHGLNPGFIRESEEGRGIWIQHAAFE
jgi:hypothetical protein